MEQQRQFRGVWVPKEIWLNKNLTQQEKMMLVEIDSLEDEEKGCWASNKHFVNIFGITASRASQVIQSLYKKGYIRIDYDMNGKEVETRHIRINRPPYPEKAGMLKTDIGMLKNDTEVCQFPKGGYVNFLKDNNTYINNTNKNIKESYFENKNVNELFEEFLKMRKKLKAVNSERAIKTLINKLNNYSDDIKIKMIENSIVNSWKGIFEIQEQNKYKGLSYKEQQYLREQEMMEKFARGEI